MAEGLDPRIKPPCDPTDALIVLKRLRAGGHIAYFAGGCVRDTLMGRVPKDWDIATDAPPPRVRELFSNTQAVGAAFGVILVRQGKSVIEVATFRSDGVYSDGRRPDSVRYTTAEEDAQRRDFTINGLFFDPIEDKIIDFVGGQKDLNARRLRAIGNPAARFEEDHLRLLRAVRFAARFALEIEPATAEAIRAHALRLKSISPERIADELRLMLTPPSRNIAWKLLADFGLGVEIFRFLPFAPAAIPLDHSIFMATAPAQGITFGLALAAATLDVRLRERNESELLALLTQPQVRQSIKAMRKALKISNEESDQMGETLLGMAPLLAPQPPTLAMKKRFLALDTAPLSRSLLDAIQSAGFFQDRIEQLQPELTELESQEYNPRPFITGDDLTNAGFSPGPRFKTILDSAYDLQLEGNLTSKSQALRWAMDHREV